MLNRLLSKSILILICLVYLVTWLLGLHALVYINLLFNLWLFS